MLDNIFKSEEKTDEVQTAVPVQPVVSVPTPTPVVTATVPTPKVCTNCEDSGFSCSVCGYNKP